MVLWVSAVQALSAYCRRHDTLEPSGTDPRDERDLGLLKRPAHSRCRGIVDRCMNQANMVTREGSGLQADRHPTRLAMTVISWGAIALTGLMQSPTQKCMSKPRVGLTWTLLLLILSADRTAVWQAMEDEAVHSDTSLATRWRRAASCERSGTKATAQQQTSNPRHSPGYPPTTRRLRAPGHQGCPRAAAESQP